MNEEQNTPGKAPEVAQDTRKEFESDKDKVADDYYSVDDPKKEVSTNIGDGEMHNEGLVGEGNIADEDKFSEGSTGEQDQAEWHDSEGLEPRVLRSLSWFRH